MRERAGRFVGPIGARLAAAGRRLGAAGVFVSAVPDVDARGRSWAVLVLVGDFGAGAVGACIGGAGGVGRRSCFLRRWRSVGADVLAPAECRWRGERGWRLSVSPLALLFVSAGSARVWAPMALLSVQGRRCRLWAPVSGVAPAGVPAGR